MDRPTIFSLSTIPSRFHLIEATLQSLLGQSLAARDVRLYIPKIYRRFPDWDGKLPPVPAGVTIARCEMDYGPATKVLPAARDLQGQDVDILFCDDDRIYDQNWHRRLKEIAGEKPGTCIVGRGDTFPDIADAHRPASRLPRGRATTKDFRYRLKRALSLYQLKPHLTTAGYVDIFAGVDGVLVRPEWFDDLFYDIPDVMWTVDDPWLSGHLERRGVPIWMAGNGFKAAANGADIDSLTDLVEADHNRERADLLVIEHFRETHGIWKKGGALDPKLVCRTPTMAELARRRATELA